MRHGGGVWYTQGTLGVYLWFMKVVKFMVLTKERTAGNMYVLFFQKAGPFCSRSCAGKYGRALQLGKITPLEVVEIEPEYIINKQLQSLSEEIQEVEPAKTGKP